MIQKLTIVNEKGLHARASAKLVELVEGFDAEVLISKDGVTTRGDSIMGLLMLVASRGTQIEVDVKGPDSEALSKAIEAMIADRFGEEI